MYLDRRANENETAIPHGAIIVIVIVAAGAAVLCAWAITSRFGHGAVQRTFNSPSGNGGMTQAQYMRDVRMRNVESLQGAAPYGRSGGGGGGMPPRRESSFAGFSAVGGGYSGRETPGYYGGQETPGYGGRGSVEPGVEMGRGQRYEDVYSPEGSEDGRRY
ncbi:hypothetical protein MBLNU230_g3276t1 [Neophaeotheca triangularis]